MNQIEKTVTSIEVAEMVGKEHAKMLRDIRTYSEQLNEAKIGLVEFFTESTYKDTKGEIRPCYLVTKKGCEFIAHKLTGIKGTEFTAKYINKFHSMENALTQMPSGQNLLALAVIEAHKVLEEKNKQLEEMKPKAALADAISVSGTGLLVRDYAKLLAQNGVVTGEKRLYSWFRANGYVCQSSRMPTQRAMEMGLFRVAERTINSGDDVIITKTTYVTGKGQGYFFKKMMEE